MIIETHDLTKRFGRHQALSGLNLSVAPGAAVALIGANGVGKSTTLRILMNLIQPDAGAATVLGVDSRKIGPALQAKIGYVAEAVRYPKMKVAAYFDFIRPLYPTWDEALEKRLRAELGLPAETVITALSNGQRMKLGLAAALAYRPSLLILDEPLSGLDPLARDEVVSGLLGNADETTILIASHEIDEIESFVTDVAFMDAGAVAFQESVEALAARVRRVDARFSEGSADGRATPRNWIDPQGQGTALSFVDVAYSGEANLKRDLSLIGPPAAVRAEPLSLRDTVKALIRAHRKEAH